MKYLSFILCILFTIVSNGQEKRSPTIIVLNSQETIIAQELDSITQTYVTKKLDAQGKKRIREENGKKFKFKAQKEIDFLQNTDISSNISFGLNYWLSFKFFEYFENMLIYPAKESNDSGIRTLEAIADKHDVNWVINIKRVEFYVENGEKKAKVDFQLYNQKFNEIVIEDQITAGDKNPGFEFACENETLSCVINNSISKMSVPILYFIGQNRNYWR
ncbi:hypothetical protein ALE3EI_1611 [Constantimarinum furrinae]|uniref:Uncharacterized protein n=2 Tax=Constantimarinum furrinae TaxID=2562285 RepID=A0A7G8PUZ9_9FLAO|nr:hypothetical protein ALE3EI_1611 [Constantimarinum furrinae]